MHGHPVQYPRRPKAKKLEDKHCTSMWQASEVRQGFSMTMTPFLSRRHLPSWSAAAAAGVEPPEGEQAS